MKKTMRHLCMATLVAMGTIITGCANLDENQQQEKTTNLTLTTTLSFSENAGTKALTSGGEKTFAVNDQVVLFYKDGKGQTLRVLSNALTASDISADGKTATITVSFLNLPATNGAVRYVYPANMAKASIATSAEINDDNTIDFTQLTNQKGTLDDLGRSLDLCVFDGNFTGTSLPASASLTNRLAILGITLNEASDITNTITRLAVSDGTNSYTVTRSAVAGPIYVAILPTASATIKVTATDGTYYYNKTLTGKSYARNNGYNVTWTMTKLPVVDLSTAGWSLNVTEDAVITGTPSKDDISINCNNDCEVILYNVNSGGTKEVTLDGGDHHLSIKLKGTSKLKYIGCNYGYNLTIDEAETGGTVILENDVSALDGSKVTINGGTVKAKSNDYYAVGCNLEVNGGNVYLAGGYDDYYGGDQQAVWGTITAGAGVTLYEWNSGWGAISSSSSDKRYITTDNASGDPTTPSAAWTW